jgi:hypothetical protein
MNRRRLAKFPWDIAVFLTITIFGFVISVAKIINPEGRGILFAATERTLSSENEPAVYSKFNSNILDIGCLKENIKIDKKYVTQDFVRVKGKLCKLTAREYKNFDGIRIKNISNGYEGTVFYQGAGNGFVSDHIALQGGKNEIEIEWKDPRSLEYKKVRTDVFDSSRN